MRASSPTPCPRALRLPSGGAARPWPLLLCLLLAAPTAALANPEAKARAAEGKHAYDLSQFDAALRAYTEAYRLDPRPALLFNIAQSHRQLGHHEEAAFYYRRYLDESPRRPANAAQTEALLQEVEARADEANRQRRLAEEAERRRQATSADAAGAAGTTPPGTDVPSAPAGATHPLLPSGATLPPAGPAASAAGTSPALATEVEPLHRRWWFWTGVGLLAAGAAGGVAYLATRPERPTLSTIDAR